MPGVFRSVPDGSPWGAVSRSPRVAVGPVVSAGREVEVAPGVSSPGEGRAVGGAENEGSAVGRTPAVSRAATFSPGVPTCSSDTVSASAETSTAPTRMPVRPIRGRTAVPTASPVSAAASTRPPLSPASAARRRRSRYASPPQPITPAASATGSPPPEARRHAAASAHSTHVARCRERSSGVSVPGARVTTSSSPA